MDKPSGSYSSWENTMCNSLAPIGEKTRLAWHDGYASAKSEWKGLTDEDIDDIAKDDCFLFIDLCRTIEAKLKDKNSG